MIIQYIANIAYFLLSWKWCSLSRYSEASPAHNAQSPSFTNLYKRVKTAINHSRLPMNGNRTRLRGSIQLINKPVLSAGEVCPIKTTRNNINPFMTQQYMSAVTTNKDVLITEHQYWTQRQVKMRYTGLLGPGELELLKKFWPCQRAEADCQHCSSCWVAITWVIKGIKAKEVSAFPRKQKFPLCGQNLYFVICQSLLLNVAFQHGGLHKTASGKIIRWPFCLESDVYTDDGENHHPSRMNLCDWQWKCTKL